MTGTRGRPRRVLGTAVLFAAVAVACGATAGGASPRMDSQELWFTNPVLGRGQDPSVVTHGRWYYYTQSSPDGTSITIRRSRSIKSLAAARKVVVWRGRRAGSPCCQWWAPELHQIDGRWYVYASADDGDNRDHRLQVLEAARPRGPYHYLGRLVTPGKLWAIDPSTLQLPNGRLFLFWSGWSARSSEVQSIYIAAMRNPWTLASKQTKLTAPTYGWERHSGGVPALVNESPEPIVHGSTVSVTYSASGCWTPQYSLGLLTARLDANLLRRVSWKKSPTPVFQSNVRAHIYGPASNGWFTSPDRTQTWLVFHAARNPRGNCGHQRQVYAQPVSWNADGTPNLHRRPVPVSQPIAVPSGDPGAPPHEASHAFDPGAS